MLHKFFEEGDWFAPKTLGYGAGLPIAWQGWVLLASYLAVMLGCGLLLATEDFTMSVLAGMGMFGATIALVLIARARTRGGWKWRS
jgi:hypothetical protein